MNIDERLERLAEHHEALAQSVELLASMTHELRTTAQQQQATIERILVAIEKDTQNIAALARIAETHERRLTDLEGGSPS